MGKIKKTRISDDQLWQLDPVWGEGVPFDLVWDVALDIWLLEAPWEVRKRAILEWRELVGGMHECHQALAHGEGHLASEHLRERIKRYATPEQLAYAKGERDDLPGGGPPRPGPVMGRS